MRHKRMNDKNVLENYPNEIRRVLSQKFYKILDNKNINPEDIRQEINLLINKIEIKNRMLSLTDTDKKTNQNKTKKEMKHWFQIMTKYSNGDGYTYETNEFEKIRRVDDEYIILLKGLVDTIELYEDEETINNYNAPFKYNYDTLAEIQLRENEKSKEIEMLDCDTGHTYDVNYDLIDKYFKEYSLNGEELIKVNIIDVLGNRFIAETID